MSGIPLQLQRRFEQRWAARFVPPAVSTAPKSIDLKRPVHNLPRIARAKEKPASLSQRDMSPRIGDAPEAVRRLGAFGRGRR
jgi:hypothetical protein